MTDTPLDKALLFDFYAELLTEKQRRYCDLHWNEDYSLAEIAEIEGLSRQSVWDIIRRSEAALRSMEEKTGIVRRYLERRAAIEDIRGQLRTLLPDSPEARSLLQRLEALI